jgi:predicted SAM-dependent methyltransferase
MWFVRKLRYVKRLIHRMNRVYERRLGARRFQRRIGSAPLRRIVIGACSKHDSGWIPTEISYLNLLKPEHWERALVPASLDAMLAEHVWEHLTPKEAEKAVQICYTYLKPGGYIRIAVPDGLHPSPEYLSWVRPGGATPGQLSNDHKVLYTYQTLVSEFEAAGFSAKLYEYFDELGEFHYRDWNTAEGTIRRSKRFDPRNSDGSLTFTSIIMDAYKPLEEMAAVSPNSLKEMAAVS